MTVLKVFFASLYALIVALALSWRENDERPSRRWAPLYDPMYAVWVLSCVFVLVVLLGGWDAGAYVFHLGASLLLHALVYYALLLLCLPLLRRYFSAQTCATLWLLPNFLIFAEQGALRGSKPLLLIPVDRRAALWLLAIWAIGAVAVLLWQIFHHLRYRRTLLRDAVEVCGRVYALWESECRRAEYKKTIPLLYSDATATPVSIGLMRGSLRVLLPRWDYTEQELTLIFRHELFHLRHMDISMKFFLSFCTAFGWFNPFMWIARRMASEDLELSCDEEVMRYSNAYERKEYARLILDHAADERGFTTCLSASAGALRYRLSRVMDARKRWGGSVVVGLAVLLLLLGYGQVDFSFDRGTVGELLPATTTIIERLHVDALDPDDNCRDVYAWDEDLPQVLQSIELRSVTGRYDFDHLNRYGSRQLEACYRNDKGYTWLELHENYALIGGKGYLYAEAPDWDALTALLDFDAPDPTPAETPDMFLSFDLPYDSNSTFFATADAEILSASADGYWVPAIDKVYTIENSSKGLPQAVELHFGYAPNSWTLLAEPLEGGEKVVVARSRDYVHVNGEAEYIVNLLPYSAHYSVRADFVSEGVLFDMAFYFDVMVE